MEFGPNIWQIYFRSRFIIFVQLGSSAYRIFLNKVRLSAHRDEVSLYHDFDFSPFVSMLRLLQITLTLVPRRGGGGLLQPP